MGLVLPTLGLLRHQGPLHTVQPRPAPVLLPAPHHRDLWLALCSHSALCSVPGGASSSSGTDHSPCTSCFSLVTLKTAGIVPRLLDYWVKSAFLWTVSPRRASTAGFTPSVLSILHHAWHRTDLSLAHMGESKSTSLTSKCSWPKRWWTEPDAAWQTGGLWKHGPPTFRYSHLFQAYPSSAPCLCTSSHTLRVHRVLLTSDKALLIQHTLILAPTSDIISPRHPPCK